MWLGSKMSTEKSSSSSRSKMVDSVMGVRKPTFKRAYNPTRLNSNYLFHSISMMMVSSIWKVCGLHFSLHAHAGMHYAAKIRDREIEIAYIHVNVQHDSATETCFICFYKKSQNLFLKFSRGAQNPQRGHKILNGGGGLKNDFHMYFCCRLILIIPMKN